LVVVNEAGSSSVALPPRGSVTLGRGDDVELKLDDAAASRRHALLQLDGPRVTLVDLGSANGTQVRGRRVEPNTAVELAGGDAIELGTTLLVLQPDLLSGATRPWTLHTHARFVELAAATKPPYALIRLQVLAPPGAAQEVLSAELSPHDSVASFGPGQFEVLAPGRSPEAARQLSERLSSRLVAAGARVRVGVATAPQDGTDVELLLGACVRPASTPTPGFVVQDDAMAALHRMLERVAPSNINVLLLGETGVGKEVLATEVHRRSRRASGPLLKLNCAALTESLLESELFGHVRGAFTGAIKDKEGLLSAARGGSVFLDEVGEMPASLQAKLLRVLEERKVTRVGAVTSEPIDVRFIFATNRDLEAEVTRGAFREDLYYRVNGLSVVIPPLRERIAEVEPLARQFIADASTREGRAAPDLGVEARRALEGWPWPGNVRELKNVIDRAVVLSGSVIDVASLGLGRAHDTAGSGLREERDAAEKRAVIDALEKTEGNQTRAAQLLGVSRRTLVSRLQRYGLTRPRTKG
jgi:transcriptional regulator with AAA-type ATPase domain